MTLLMKDDIILPMESITILATHADEKPADINIVMVRGAFGKTWYIYGKRVESMDSLKNNFGIDPAALTALILAHGKPSFGVPRPTPSPYQPRLKANYERFREQEKMAMRRRRGRYPYHAFVEVK